jgi:CubicO group peptidase (beta-lactamase class C family)
MFSANYAVMKLVTDGLLDVDMPITEILGDAFAGDTLDIAYQNAETVPGIEKQKEWKRGLTVRDILRHQAGFPADPHYFDPDYDLSLMAKGEPGSNPCYAVTREDTLRAIFKTPLLYEPGTQTVYSDVDFMLLTFIVEKITGKRLDAYMRETFYGPMGLDRITFLPTENGFAAEDCAATELNGNTRDGHVFFDGVRTETLQGQVHDEKAWYCMGGVSGHAGLFACSGDLARLASVMLTGGYGGNRFFSRNVIDLFTAPKAFDFGQWGLGWWREGDDQRVWYFGTQSSASTVGHQGWTGTLVMIDPSRDLVVVYLTNKINSPVTDPEKSLNSFDGSCFTASTLGFVPQILSIGMDTDKDVSAQLLDLTADMAAESLKLIPEGAGPDHPYVKNALSKISVLRKRAGDAGSRRYLEFADTLEARLPKR